MLSLSELDGWHPAASDEVVGKLLAKESAYRMMADDLQRKVTDIESNSHGQPTDAATKDLKGKIAHWNGMIASCERLKTLFTETPEALTKIKQRAAEAQSLAERYEFKLGQHGELLDPYGGGTPPGMSADDAQRRKEMGAQIQEQIKQVLQDATDLNDKVAAALGKEREAMNDVFGNGSGSFEQAPAHDTNNERTQNQINAYAQVYGHAPVTEADWQMAAALDPHSYDPKNKGVPPQIVAGRFPPQPGKGVVRTNLFIPAGWVWNAGDGTDALNGKPGVPNLGDNRGPNANADAEASRVSVFVDYERGIVVTRQNPSVKSEGHDSGAQAAVPEVHAAVAPDGRLTIDYNARDPYEPGLAAGLGFTVNGRITLSPHADGTVGVGGDTTVYPSMETYQYRDGHPTAQLQWTPAVSGSEWGPGFNLGKHHPVGDPSIPPVMPITKWQWELESVNPFEGDPFTENTTQLSDPSKGAIPTMRTGH